MNSLVLFGHPFSSYTWKALIAFHEKGLSCKFRTLSPDHPENGAAFAGLSPTGKFPVLTDGEQTVFEATAIVDYLDLVHPSPRLIPDGLPGVEARMMDRVFDQYVMDAVQGFVADALGIGSEAEVARGRATLDKSYAWLDAKLGEDWMCGGAFTLADCAAAPSLFYADWAYPFPEGLTRLKAYRARLLARPSVARCVDGARPYRHLFPLGAPDRD